MNLAINHYSAFLASSAGSSGHSYTFGNPIAIGSIDHLPAYCVNQEIQTDNYEAII
ncbi:MAG: hypothetical protein ABUT20_27715 [Bacteroidota bacterium]